MNVGTDLEMQLILDEVNAASHQELVAYFCGASRDGTFNKGRRTYRISQKDPRWLTVLQSVLKGLGHRSWTYREGKRDVWVVETCLIPHRSLPSDASDRSELAAFARGYFDAEGGIPKANSSRFYVQLVQKDRVELSSLRDLLTDLGLRCGRLHNPSVRVDPNYWRFYIRADSHRAFIDLVDSWHPRKRLLLEERRLSWSRKVD